MFLVESTVWIHTLPFWIHDSSLWNKTRKICIHKIDFYANRTICIFVILRSYKWIKMSADNYDGFLCIAACKILANPAVARGKFTRLIRQTDSAFFLIHSHLAIGFESLSWTEAANLFGIQMKIKSVCKSILISSKNSSVWFYTGICMRCPHISTNIHSA